MKTFLCFLISVLFTASLIASEKPNIILIITDDQSWDTIGFLGGEVYTPRIDKMAEEGLYFSDFNVTTTVCTPSRYSFLTGRYAGNSEGPRFMRLHPPGDQTQVENIVELEMDRWNLPRVLQKNGYKTGFVGKSHLVNHDWINGDWEAAGLKPYPQDADPRDPEISARMRYNHQKWCEAIKPYGFDYVDGVYCANLRELFNDALNVHNLDWTVDKAFTFIEENRNNPFFLYFSTTLHHGPDPGVSKYGLGADPRMTGEGFVAEGFEVLPARDEILKRNREAGYPDNTAHALWLDEGVGALLDKLKDLGIEENTLVVFVSDHGSWRHGKTTLHDNGMRVPMIMQWKGKIEPGSTYDGLVGNIDFAPTVLDLLDIRPPADYEIDGVSFKRALMGSQDPVRDVLFGEIGHSRAVKTKKWKYIAIRYPEEIRERIARGEKFNNWADNPPVDQPYLTRNSHLGYHAALVNPHYFDRDQLYDLTKDPQENDNIFDERPKVSKRMQKLLSEALKQFENRPYGEFTD